jgi:hypothetical protein
MKLQLRKYEGDKYTICAYDSNGVCHVNKAVDMDEFDHALAYYFDKGYDVTTRTDNGQSDEIYEVALP